MNVGHLAGFVPEFAVSAHIWPVFDFFNFVDI